jgi:acyl carrier protein
MSTLDALKQLLHERFDVDASTLDPETPLVEYGLDSLSLAELMFTVEEHFNVDFPSSQQDVDTLQGLAELIDSLLLAKAA